MHEKQEVMRAQKGDKEAFSRLIKQNEVSLYRIARSIVKADDACADAIQEAILKAYTGIVSLREARYFKTWLIRILIHECYRILQEKRRFIPTETIHTAANESSLQAMERTIEVQEIVDALEDELRLPVILYYFENLSVKEVGKLLALPEGTVKSRLSRARKKLAQALHYPEQGGNSDE
ncbi:sigma-70 family RNA polymerase sigma factor [Aneurinibacillus sp. UBA3580]|uniref:sigma-70 family RNA polymerase sigma factor n=1 Tax=Aneurinibacillus sp. UBA3580 TaxID=1946041 RepID=UPI002580C20D|nr:sigma-70 family RNA polymerase sigma factor [Aneurinibacillus sp. UBA3580]